MTSASPSPIPMNLDHVLKSFDALGHFVSNAKERLKSDSITGVSIGLGNGVAIAIDDSNGSTTNRQMDDDSQKLCNQAEKLQRDINYIKGELSKLKDLNDDFHILGEQSSKVNGIIQASVDFPSQQVHERFQFLAEKLKKVRKKMPGHRMYSLINDSHNPAVGAVFGAYYVFDKTPNYEQLKRRMKTIVWGTSAFQEFLDDFVCVYDNLDRQIKLCLLCFSVFPENAVLEKRLLVHWWIGEGLVDPPLTGENTADDILKLLLSKGFVEPVMVKRKLVGFKVDPLVRFVVIKLAEKAGFFDFDDMGVPTAKFSWSYRACLVRSGKDFSAKEFKNKDPSELEQLRTLFNVNDPYPDFPQELFVKFKNLNVLFLGGWGASSKHHIEVESTEFLKGVKHMKHLKFISLGGISRINDFPGEVCEVSELRIMDLHACHNLETLPKTLSRLKNLTHLDISECFLLDHIPNGLAFLTNLQVLKGFVIGGSVNMTKDSCTLKDLENLRKLRKLSISTSMKNFPSTDDVSILQKFEVLKKLTISWGGNSSEAAGENNCKATDSSSSGAAQAATTPILQKFEVLKKLTVACGGKSSESADEDDHKPSDSSKPKKILARSLAFRDEGGLDTLELQCYPRDAAPKWMFQELAPHKKLYIRGGNMRVLGNEVGKTFNVKMLCLKFLAELRMDWRELQKSFPRLMYLETVSCPNLSFFPCDESGIWLDKDEKPEQFEDANLGLSWSFLMNSTIRSDAHLFPS